MGATGNDRLMTSRYVVRRDASAPTPYGRFYAPDPAWLEKAEPEEIIEPALPIVDTHHHLWDLPGYRYLIDEFAADLRTGHNIVATVYNECRSMYRARGPADMQAVGEVEFCAGMAAMSDSGKYGPTRINAGIVGFADLTLGDRLSDLLEAHIKAGGGRFRGVRHAATWDSDPTIEGHAGARKGLYLEPEFQAGLKRLTSFGLTFDAWVLFPQLPDLVSLARACPDARIILNHLGGPLGYGQYTGKGDQVFRAWEAGMKALASCPNVAVKLGGTMMRLAPYDYGRSAAPITSQRLADILRPYVLSCVELFGASRCMVESNYPVEKMGIGYAALFNTFKRILNNLSPTEKSAVFSGAACRIYGLKLD